jgi:hypothetical protein
LLQISTRGFSMAKMSSYTSVDDALVERDKRRYVAGSKILVSGPDPAGNMVNLNVPIDELRGDQTTDWAANPGEPGYIKNKPNLKTVATSGSYNDLLDKPDIPPPQVQSDWSQTDITKPSYIWNKPDIPPEQVQADWEETGTNKKSYIKNKPTKVSAFSNDAGYLTQHQDISGKANKSEMSIVDLVSEPDKSVITLKDGCHKTVLTQHQDISGKANKSEMAVIPGTGENRDKTTVQLRNGISAVVLTKHQDISGKADKVEDPVDGNLVSLDSEGNIVDSGFSKDRLTPMTDAEVEAIIESLD